MRPPQCRPSRSSRFPLLLLLWTGLTTPPPHTQAARSLTASKRGLAYMNWDNPSDNRLLVSNNSSISWYYTWSIYPASSFDVGEAVPFVPLIHAVSDAEDSNLASRLSRLPASSTHLLAFNEPDGTTDSGGSAITPGDAAKAYLQHLGPLRTGSGSGRTWKLSHPCVTGSPRGLEWLRHFVAECYKLDKAGCPADFVAVHWYGAFDGLAGWLGALREFYTNSSSASTTQPPAGTQGANNGTLKFWITEMALPQGDGAATRDMMKAALPYLDGLEYVQAYAWFGAFRQDSGANEWTGDQVALFDSSGGLTDLGAIYLGGEESGFEEGMKGEGPSGAAVEVRVVRVWAVVVAVLGTTLWILL